MLQATLLRQYNLNFLLLSVLQEDKRQLQWFCEEKIEDTRTKLEELKRGESFQFQTKAMESEISTSLRPQY